MAHVKPIISNNVSLTPGVAFITKNSNLVYMCSIPRKLNVQKTFPAQKHTLPLSTSIRLFPQFRCGYILKSKLITSAEPASGVDVAVEEADVSQADNETSVTTIDSVNISGESSTKQEISPITSKRSRPIRRSEMPTVKNEQLIPGATFKGKVRSIQPFGAFVDFGAFMDGLVHVSRLSDSFVKDVANIVTVGQEVTVRIIEANMENSRISLSMRESDDLSNPQSPASGDKSRPPRKYNQKRDETKKNSKCVKGQDLEGTVKNLTRSGAFISLPEGEEGFLPHSEEADEGLVNIMGGSSLEVGQEVSVRVLRINRGQVTLTMKKEEDAEKLDAILGQGVVHAATNPFVLAFRSNQAISAFLEGRAKQNEEAEVSYDKKDAIVGGIHEVAEISSGIVEEANENAILSESSDDHSFTDDTEKDREPLISGELTDQASPDILEQIMETSADNILGNDEDLSEKTKTTELSVTQDEDETATLDRDKKGSIDDSGAQMASLDLEPKTTECLVGGDVVDSLIAVTEVEKQTLADPQNNGNISSPSEPNSYASSEETSTRGIKKKTKSIQLLKVRIAMLTADAAVMSAESVKDCCENSGATFTIPLQSTNDQPIEQI